MWLLYLFDDHCYKIPVDPFYEQQCDFLGHRGYEKCIQAMVRKCEGNRPFGSCKQEDNIKMDLKEIGCVQDLTQDKVQFWAAVNAVMNT
jgi:hypothetical protein